MDRARQIWEDLGEKDAYFAVSTFDEFREGNLDAAAKERFFQTGRDHVEDIWNEIKQHFDIDLKPDRSLDYGCGVGRILIPLAEKSKSVAGVDISSAMLSEARKNCDERGIKNIELVDADMFMKTDAEKFDFVHSFIVLQHIAPRIGMEIIRKMLSTLNKDGVGMIHVTFCDMSPRLRAFRARIYRDFPFAHRIVRLVRGNTEQFMPMYEYSLDQVFQIFDENGCGDRFVKETDHGFKGVMIYFRKSKKRN